MTVNQFAALSFVELEDVAPTFNQIYESIGEIDDDTIKDALYEIANNFQINFISLNNADPFYKKELWNQRVNLLDNSPRTNNLLEGWHRHFIGLASTCHPRLYAFIDMVKKDIDTSRVKIIENRTGQNPPRSRPVYTELTNRLKNIILNNLPAFDTVRAISYVYTFASLI